MDFKAMAENCNVLVSKLSIKNKGSVVKISDYYVKIYNVLLEKYGLKCDETRYWNSDVTADGMKRLRWSWFAYKPLDDFSRLRFDLDTNAYYVKGNKVMGIFKVSYKIELDYNKVWRNNKLLNWFLPYYLKHFYQGVLIQWLVKFKDELASIKEQVRKHLNIEVFE